MVEWLMPYSFPSNSLILLTIAVVSDGSCRNATCIVSIGILTYAFVGFNLMYPGEFGMIDGVLGFAGIGLAGGFEERLRHAIASTDDPLQVFLDPQVEGFPLRAHDPIVRISPRGARSPTQRCVAAGKSS